MNSMVENINGKEAKRSREEEKENKKKLESLCILYPLYKVAPLKDFFSIYQFSDVVNGEFNTISIHWTNIFYRMNEKQLMQCNIK